MPLVDANMVLVILFCNSFLINSRCELYFTYFCTSLGLLSNLIYVSNSLEIFFDCNLLPVMLPFQKFDI